MRWDSRCSSSPTIWTPCIPPAIAWRCCRNGACWPPRRSTKWPAPTMHGCRRISTDRAAARPPSPPTKARTDIMETRAHHILIRMLPVLVVLFGLGFGVWLAKAHSDQEWNYYDIVFNEAVTGLSRGGAVQYN